MQMPDMATAADLRQRVDSELIESLCSALREYLERRVELLNEEVRNYPTPIARCDDQLTGLLEQRAGAAAQLQRLSSLSDQDLSRADGAALAGELIDLLLNRR
jgi:chorismate mutase